MYAVYQTNKDTTTKYQLKVIVTNGTINNSSSKIYQLEANGIKIVEATPNPGYSKMNVTCGKGITSTTSGNRVTFKNITKDTSCNIKFSPATVRVNYKYENAPFDENSKKFISPIPNNKTKDYELTSEKINIKIQDKMYSEIICKGLDGAGAIEYKYSYQSGNLEFKKKQSATCNVTYKYIKHTFNFCSTLENGKCILYHDDPQWGIQGGTGKDPKGFFSIWKTIDKDDKYTDNDRARSLTAYIYDPINFVADITAEGPGEGMLSAGEGDSVYSFIPFVESNITYYNGEHYTFEWTNRRHEGYHFIFAERDVNTLINFPETFIIYAEEKTGAFTESPGAENLLDQPYEYEDGDWVTNGGHE